jgi:hypothetical protein
VVFRGITFKELPKVTIQRVHVAAKRNTLLPVIPPVLGSSVFKSPSNSPKSIYRYQGWISLSFGGISDSSSGELGASPRVRENSINYFSHLFVVFDVGLFDVVY